MCMALLIPVWGQSGDSSGALIGNSGDRVMIVPFRSYNYISDADYDLASANRLTMSDVSTQFRYGLDLSLTTKVSTHYNGYSILQDTLVSSAADLRRIYSGVSFKYQKSMDVTGEYGKQEDVVKEDLFGRHEEGEEKRSKEKEEQREYMNAIIRDPGLIAHLAATYNVDYFIFINHFELKTDYETCLDRATNNFKRVIAVHYSIYDASGKQLKGDVIDVTFGSADTRMADILDNYISTITSGIAGALNNQLMVQNEPRN